MNIKKSKPAGRIPSIVPTRLNAAFNLIESIVVLATIGVLVFIAIPVLKVYVFEKGDKSAPVYIEQRGTESSLPPSSDGAGGESAEPDASSGPAE